MNLKNYNPFVKKLLYDNKDRAVHYDYNKKISYYIDKDEMKKYGIFTNSWAIAIILGVVVNGLFLDLIPSITLGVFVFFAVNIYFHKKYLPSLTHKVNVQRDSLHVKDKEVRNDSTGKAILRSVLYTALGILIVLNAYQQNFHINDKIAFYASCAVAAGSIIYALTIVYKTFIKK